MLLTLAIFNIAAKASTVVRYAKASAEPAIQPARNERHSLTRSLETVRLTSSVRRHETQGEHLAEAKDSLRNRAFVVTANGNVNQSPNDSASSRPLDAGRLADMVRRHDTRGENLNEPTADRHLDSMRKHVAVIAAAGDSSLASGDVLKDVEGDLSSTTFSSARLGVAEDAPGNRNPVLNWPATGFEDSLASLRASPREDTPFQSLRRSERLSLNAAHPAPLQGNFAKLPHIGVRPHWHVGSRYLETRLHETPTANALAHTPANFSSHSVAVPALTTFTVVTSGLIRTKPSAAAPSAMSTVSLPLIRKKQAAGLGPVLGGVLLEEASAVQQPITTAAPAQTTATPASAVVTTATPASAVVTTATPVVGSTTTNVATPDAAAVPPPEESGASWMFTVSGFLECVCIVVPCILFLIAASVYVRRGSTLDNPSGAYRRRLSTSHKSNNTAGATGSQLPYDASAQNHREVEALLKEVDLFKRLPDESVRTLAKNLGTEKFDAGETLVKQGEQGNEFFMIWKGTASVKIDGQIVTSLKPGDHFGESSLLCSEPRHATIVSKTALVAFTITKEKFANLGLNEKYNFPKRMAVARGGDKDVRIEPPTPKTEEEEQLIINAVRENKSLAFMRLTEKSLIEVAATAWKVDVASGTEIITQGDMPAAYFYVVQEGSFMVSVVEESIWHHAHSQSSGARDSLHTKLVKAHGSHTIGKGGSFGALALLYNAPRSATVTAKEPSAVWVIARPHLRDVLLKAAEEHIGEYVQHLNEVQVTQNLPEEQKVNIAKALMEMTFKKGDVLCKQGHTGDTFFILVEGIVDIKKDGISLFRNGDYPTASPGKGVSFGQAGLEAEGNRRTATVEILSDKARCLVLDKTSYDILLGKYSPQRNTRKLGEIHFKDLKRLGILGCGGFGSVELVEHTQTGKAYALKIQSKGFIVEQQIEAFVINEKNLQLMCDSAFVTKLLETFNDGESLYMLLELCLGGELWDVYNKKGLWGSVPHAKFYAAGIVFAFEHLHGKKILFRDLKPENMLLSESGQVKLTDLGLAKQVVGKTFSICGTPEYLAPEVISSKGTTSAADWWAMGVVMFELFASYPAFNAASPMAIFKSIWEGIDSVEFPKVCKGDVKRYIQGLCQHEPHERLPMKQGWTQNLKDHAWYRGFDWDAMFNLTIVPPYVPQVKHKKDMSNFSSMSTKTPSMLPKQIPYQDPGTGWDKDFATSA